MTADHTPDSPDPHARLLPKLEVPVPCMESWDAMQGNAQVRHCGLCRKDVYNLSAMGQAEAAALLAANADGGVCVRFYRRSDGTVMTSDCGASPRVRLHRAVRTLPRIAAGAAGVAGAAAVAVAVAHAKPPALHGAPEENVVVVSLEQERMPMLMGVPMIMPERDIAPPPTMGKPVAMSEPAPAPPALPQPPAASADAPQPDHDAATGDDGADGHAGAEAAADPA